MFKMGGPFSILNFMAEIKSLNLTSSHAISLMVGGKDLKNYLEFASGFLNSISPLGFENSDVCLMFSLDTLLAKGFAILNRL